MDRTTKTMGATIASVAIVMVATLGFVANESEDGDGLTTFASKADLLFFLAKNKPDDQWRTPYGGSFLARSDLEESALAPYSSTNIQVAGVDESDTVKTDGEYIYVATSNNVTIIKSYPPEALKIVSRVEVSSLELGEGGYNLDIAGIFLESNRLVMIVGAHSANYGYWLDSDQKPLPPKTIVAVYDVTDRAHPSFVQSYAVSGWELSSRMIESCVYLMTQQSIWTYDDAIIMPTVWEDNESFDVTASDIHYDPDTSEVSSFVNVLAVDIGRDTHELLSVIAGYASTVYMSSDALYFTVQKYSGSIEWLDGQAAPEDVSTALTSIYKINVDELLMSVHAKADVKGWLLNQFSMDDDGTHLRVATNTGWSDPENAVYVLDGDLATVGKLEGLAPDERIYSSRFIGDTLYLVTFRQVDPLFVIDLRDPTNPHVAGELKIPGYSSYLHPVGPDHVLGIGMEGADLKVSLFNVSDPSNPTEQSRCIPDGNWYSDALYDHKAVLFDLEKELLVIPGYSWSYDGYSSTYGALVFSVSLSDGISYRGVVKHDLGESYYSSERITRSMYIGDCLYTVGYASIQVNQLEDLSYVAGLVFNDYDEYSYRLLV